MSLFATEKLPSPVAMDGIVSIDNYQRNLVVSRPENASGYEKLAWRTAHGYLAQAKQNGWRSAAPTVWAHSAEARDIAFGVPGDNLTLLFHFPVGKREYVELVSQPGLMALVTIDRSAGVFMGVKFIHGRRES